VIANLSSSTISRLIVILAAGIILATFVVKDIASERFKNARDSLDRTSTMHFTLSYNLFVQDYLASIKQSADLTLSMLESNGKTPSENSTQALRIRIQAAQDHVKVLNEYTRSVARLIDQLPQQSEKKYTAAVLVAKSNKLLDEVNSLDTRLSGLVNDNRSESSTSGEFIGRLNVISDETKPIMEAANDLSWSFVNDLALQKEKVQRNYEFTVQVSYVLFTLGWVIGLVGQILRKDTDTPSS